jgi:signal transduction histidine kinase
MWAGTRCPRCGCPHDHVGGTDPPAEVTAVDVEIDRSIELLQTEVAELRATVARLRGSGFTGVAPTDTSRR